MTPVYKLLSQGEWAAAQAVGVFEGSAADLADGYIHFSTGGQLAETARRHFPGRSDLMLLAVDPGGLGEALRWEPSRGGALFPHLYAPLPLSAVVLARAAPLTAAGTHELGALEA